MAEVAPWIRMIPEGYEVEKTNKRVQVMTTRWTRRGAERAARKYPPTLPSYHLRVERRGFLAWEVVAYQNVLRPKDQNERRT